MSTHVRTQAYLSAHHPQKLGNRCPYNLFLDDGPRQEGKQDIRMMSASRESERCFDILPTYVCMEILRPLSSRIMRSISRMVITVIKATFGIRPLPLFSRLIHPTVLCLRWAFVQSLATHTTNITDNRSGSQADSKKMQSTAALHIILVRQIYFFFFYNFISIKIFLKSVCFVVKSQEYQMTLHYPKFLTKFILRLQNIYWHPREVISDETSPHTFHSCSMCSSRVAPFTGFRDFVYHNKQPWRLLNASILSVPVN